jgi:hypothetical protein
MNKILISIGTLLVAGILASLWYGDGPKTTVTYGPSDVATTSTTSETPLDTVVDIPQQSTVSVQPRASFEAPAPTPRTSTPICSSTIRITIESAVYETCIEDGVSLLSAMQTATSDGLVFTGKEYPSLGFFVESINGKHAENGYYWFLYVNGESSSAGVSETVVRAGDSIEWRYKQSY